MRCYICGKIIEKEISFSKLGIFDFVCEDCSTLLKPKETYIPLDHGYLMRYIYYLVNDKYERMIESRIFPSLYLIFEWDKNRTYIILDEEIVPYLKYLDLCQNITVISIKYIPLEDLLE